MRAAQKRVTGGPEVGHKPIRMAALRDANRLEISEAIYEAAQTTCRWMRNFMQPKPREGLETKEREYYADLANAAGRAISSNY